MRQLALRALSERTSAGITLKVDQPRACPSHNADASVIKVGPIKFGAAGPKLEGLEDFALPARDCSETVTSQPQPRQLLLDVRGDQRSRGRPTKI